MQCQLDQLEIKRADKRFAQYINILYYNFWTAITTIERL